MVEEQLTKKCFCCNCIKLVNHFSKNSNTKDKLQSQCKDCNKLMKLRNKEKAKKQNAEWHIKNKERRNKDAKEWYLKNRESHLLRSKEYREKNYTSCIEAKNKWKKSQNGKASSKKYNHNRRILLKNGSISISEINDLEQNAKTCYWCNVSLKNVKVHIDHYIPISKGGQNSNENIVLSCSLCNLSKGSKDPILFANSIGKLL